MPELADDDRLKAYRHVFGRGRLAKKVLADLMAYAMVLERGIEPDGRGQDFMAGRRDVVVYILNSMGIGSDYEDIARALAGVRVPQPQPEQMEADHDVDGNE